MKVKVKRRTYQAAHNERLASVDKYLQPALGMIPFSQVLHQLLEVFLGFISWGSYTALTSLPKLKSMCSYVLANKTTATSL